MITKKLTSKNAMSLDQRKSVMHLLKDSFGSVNLVSLLDSLNLSKVEAEEIIEKGSLISNRLEKTISDLLKEISIIDSRFGSAISEFEIVIPENYNHDNHIDDFARRVKDKKSTYYLHDEFNSMNFNSKFNKLESGKIYKIKIFPILEAMSSEDCLCFLRKQNAILAGGQAITFVYDMSNGQLPKGKRIVSFGEKESFGVTDDNCKVAFLLPYLDDSFKFDFDLFSRNWRYGDCILCVYKECLDSLFLINRN